jgi:hypothetical protein
MGVNRVRTARRSLTVSSVATLQPAAVVFREEQYFDWRVHALAAVVGLLTGLALIRQRIWSLEVAAGLFIGVALLVFLVVFLLHMTTEVAPNELRVWFGWAPGSARVVAISAIRHIDVVTYRPIADYGFWGIRAGRDGEKAYIARGTRGVRIELNDGSRFLVGSQRPEALASALDSAMRPA